MIPGDAANIPEDAIRFDPTESVDELLDGLSSGSENVVFVNEAMSTAAIDSHVADATDALLGESVDGQFPFITLALSGWREITLLKNRRTTVGTALKNAALDVTGTGVGGLAGAEVGAVIGTAIAPGPGSVIGAAVGALVGAVAGRFTSNSIKYRPVRRALESAREAQDRLKAEASRQEAAVAYTFQRCREAEQSALSALTGACKARVEKEADALRRWRAAVNGLTGAEAKALLTSGVRDLECAQASLRDTWRMQSCWRRWFWPTTAGFALEGAIRQLRGRVARLQVLAARLMIKGRCDVFDVMTPLASFGVAHRAVRGRFTATEGERVTRESQLRATVQRARADVVERRKEAVRQLEHLLNRSRGEVRSALRPHVEAVERAIRCLQVEAGKVGSEAKA
jgi:hypothetical protein